MAKKKKDTKQTSQSDTAANLGFEAKLWAAADALRNNMDAAEYKHVALGPGLDKQRLGQLINLVSDISFSPSALRDVLLPRLLNGELRVPESAIKMESHVGQYLSGAVGRIRS